MSAHRLILATRNVGKIEELRRILADLVSNPAESIELVGTDEFGLDDVEETGDTFAANALIKARAVANATGLPAIADDSGLCVDALNGMPGIYSARWSGRHGDDQANLALLLAQLSHVPEVRRGAHFACAAALVIPGVTEIVEEGRIVGTLISEPRGSGGFGYDPIFMPLGCTQTMAQLSADEKDEISHRGLAFRALAPRVAALLILDRPT
ncbi:MAG TPA: RdgB/HAM1 family non-canonical purine NTP pyrophosphatase [Candidatus Nanopelagicaceae bacterium]|nr:RdgB/HAM1 family non-canonical purine NTP pyrophosphatase [Candidatus Nanopelagicaceae bacterium]